MINNGTTSGTRSQAKFLPVHLKAAPPARAGWGGAGGGLTVAAARAGWGGGLPARGRK